HDSVLPTGFIFCNLFDFNVSQCQNPTEHLFCCMGYFGATDPLPPKISPIHRGSQYVCATNCEKLRVCLLPSAFCPYLLCGNSGRSSQTESIREFVLRMFGVCVHPLTKFHRTWYSSPHSMIRYAASFMASLSISQTTCLRASGSAINFCCSKSWSSSGRACRWYQRPPLVTNHCPKVSIGSSRSVAAPSRESR